MITLRNFLTLSCVVTLCSADHSCVCNYEEDNHVWSQPDSQSAVIDHMYEFDCKPLYSGYTGSNFSAVQIGGKIGYIDAKSNIQLQTCAGDPSPFDVVSTVAPTVTTSTTTQRPTTPSTREISTMYSTTQRPTTLATREISTMVSTTQRPTTLSTRQISTMFSTTQKPTSTSTSRTYTNPMYHRSNVTNTTLKYIGVSYNLTIGNPIRGTETTSMTDPGLLLGNQVFQLNEFPNGTWREVELSNMSGHCYTQYSLIQNGKSYQDELLVLVRPTDQHPQQLVNSSFMFNTEFRKVLSYTENKQSTNIYEDMLTICSQEKLRLKDELADTEPLSITRDFAKDACDLPEFYDVNEYINFLDKWGTSIVVEAVLGTKELKRYQTTEQDLFRTVNQKNSSLIHHAGAYMGYASSLTLSRQDYTTYIAKTTNPGTAAAVYKTDAGMVPVGLKLEPMTFAFAWKFWKDVLGDYIAAGVCREGITQASIQNMAENINRTLPQYFAAKNTISGLNVSPLTDGDLHMPVTWPKGTYGLMKASSGCPSGHVTWREGWRTQDSLSHLSTHHHFTAGISNTLSGSFGDRILTRYCMKTDSIISIYDTDWPRGSYCVLKKGNCPTGFAAGSVYWDDSDFINKNEKGGTLPDGSYNKNTRIYYCCRNDGSTSSPITLPIDRPFVLLRYKGLCQKVYGMSMREVYIQWDTADLFNDDSTSGAHPLDDGGDGHKLHFCFYYFNSGGVLIG